MVNEGRSAHYTLLISKRDLTHLTQEKESVPVVKPLFTHQKEI